MKILRVFPRQTRATPQDDLVRFGPPDLLDPPDCDEVHISVTFTWDRIVGKRLAESWESVHSCVKIGGPAFGDCGDFVAGRYLRLGHVITSRGCPKACSFCYVPRREGKLRELPITDGWILHDNNLLACSQSHIERVFAMIKRQPHRAVFAGGLDAQFLTNWHIDLMVQTKPNRVYFAFDNPNMSEPLMVAGKMMQSAGFTKIHHLYCYVLIGHPGDSFDAAENRCRFAWAAGFTPFAMLFRNDRNQVSTDWQRFQRQWCRPFFVRSKCRRSVEEIQTIPNEISHLRP